MVTHTIGFTDGVFDLMHYGHIRYLQRCKEHCDKLIVAVADDQFARAKNPGRPIIDQWDRLMSIRALKCVDQAYLCDGSIREVNELCPDIYFRYTHIPYQLDPRLDPEIAKRIKYIHSDVNYSTTTLIERIKRL